MKQKSKTMLIEQEIEEDINKENQEKNKGQEPIDTEEAESGNRTPIIIVVITVMIIVLLGLAVAASKKEHSPDELIHLGFLNDVAPEENNSEQQPQAIESNQQNQETQTEDDFIEVIVTLDTNLQDFEANGGEQQFISTIASNLNLDPSLIEITDKREGSVILTFRVKSDGTLSLADLETKLNQVLLSDIGYPILEIAGLSDPCQCVGSENLPTDYFVQRGFSSEYGTSCEAWDSKEAYCQEGGANFGEDWCSDSYSWCYVDKACDSGMDTVFFVGTEYEDSLSYASTPCDNLCECVGSKNLPTEYFVEQGYSEQYGSGCESWDSQESYCQEGGQYFGEDWCSESYSWCYVNKACKSGIETLFFTGTEYEDQLAYTTEPCQDPCECVGKENLPSNYFEQQGYSANYGSSCVSWDSQEAYCQEDGAYFGEGWCGNSYQWCYVGIECEHGIETLFFADTEYENQLAYSTVSCQDPCECVGPENLPTDYFVEQGYQEKYGSGCESWDSQEVYCQEGGLYFGEDWCSESYEWCYVDIECEYGIETLFFADTQYADTLAYTQTTCEQESTDDLDIIMEEALDEVFQEMLSEIQTQNQDCSQDESICDAEGLKCVSWTNEEAGISQSCQDCSDLSNEMKFIQYQSGNVTFFFCQSFEETFLNDATILGLEYSPNQIPDDLIYYGTYFIVPQIAANYQFSDYLYLTDFVNITDEQSYYSFIYPKSGEPCLVSWLEIEQLESPDEIQCTVARIFLWEADEEGLLIDPVTNEKWEFVESGVFFQDYFPNFIVSIESNTPQIEAPVTNEYQSLNNDEPQEAEQNQIEQEVVLEDESYEEDPQEPEATEQEEIQSQEEEYQQINEEQQQDPSNDQIDTDKQSDQEEPSQDGDYQNESETEQEPPVIDDPLSEDTQIQDQVEQESESLPEENEEQIEKELENDFKLITTCNEFLQYANMAEKYSTSEVKQSKVIPGYIEAYPDFMAVQTQNEDEVLVDFTVMIELYQGYFYGREIYRGVYNHMDFQIDYFELEKQDKVFPCYKLYPPQTEASAGYKVIMNSIGYRFQDEANYTIYSYEYMDLRKIMEVSSDQVKPGEFIKIEGIEQYPEEFEILLSMSGTDQPPKSYCFVPSLIDMSISTNDPEKNSEQLNIYTREVPPKIKIVNTIFNIEIDGLVIPTESDYPYGPNDYSNRYGASKYFVHVGKSDDGGQMIYWQDQSSKQAYLTTIYNDETQKTISLPIDQDHDFGTAVAGEPGQIYYITFQANPTPDQTRSTIDAFIYLSTIDGSTIKKQELLTDSLNFNIYEYFGHSHIVYNAEKKFVGVHVARTMIRSGDGLNHQGSWMQFFDPETLEVIRPSWASSSYDPDYSTASHTMSSNILLTENGMMSGVEIGDNFPRGILFWSADLENLNSELIYAIKTKHNDKETENGSRYHEVYSEISTDDQTFYKYSNDNNVYTEISAPGFLEQSDGYLVFFVGERPSLDNSKTGGLINTPRNIGFTKVSKDLRTKLSPGEKETGGYYDFIGTWTDLEHEGIQWVTNFEALSDSVSRLKVAQISSELILLLFEIWSPDEYKHTAYILVDKDGYPQDELKVMELCYPMRLLKADDPIIMDDGSILLVQGTYDGKLSTFKISIEI